MLAALAAAVTLTVNLPGNVLPGRQVCPQNQACFVPKERVMGLVLEVISETGATFIQDENTGRTYETNGNGVMVTDGKCYLSLADYLDGLTCDPNHFGKGIRRATPPKLR